MSDIRAPGDGLRQIMIDRVRKGINSGGYPTSYDDLFVLPLAKQSNRSIEHMCHKRYMARSY